MTRKQLQVLLSAGIFSSALLNGLAYAEKPSAEAAKTAPSPVTDAARPVDPASVVKDSADTSDAKHATSKKSTQDQACGGAAGCGTAPVKKDGGK